MLKRKVLLKNLWTIKIISNNNKYNSPNYMKHIESETFLLFNLKPFSILFK